MPHPRFISAVSSLDDNIVIACQSFDMRDPQLQRSILDTGELARQGDNKIQIGQVSIRDSKGGELSVQLGSPGLEEGTQMTGISPKPLDVDLDDILLERPGQAYQETAKMLNLDSVNHTLERTQQLSVQKTSPTINDSILSNFRNFHQLIHASRKPGESSTMQSKLPYENVMSPPELATPPLQLHLSDL